MLDEPSNIHSMKSACSTLDQAPFSGTTWNDYIGFHSLQNRVGKGMESYSHSVRRKRVNSIDSVGGRILGFVIFLIRGLLAISNFDHTRPI